MGRNKKRQLKRDFKEPREDIWKEKRKPREDGTGYEAPDLNNAMFEEYYKRQQIIPEGEWDAFMACLRRPLPTTFRIIGGGKFAADLRDHLDTAFFAKLRQGPVTVDGETMDLEAPKPIPWYPDKLGWQFTYSRFQLRKVKALEEVHELLKRENEAGSITRQEAVSMVPPLFLDVQPHHRVLDTCAAPGSKTAQMLELLHKGAAMPSGCVVANDQEVQRCNLLVHQTKRMCSPALLVTNHDATRFPSVAPFRAPHGEAVRFERVLCDVPCSGDGTMRKAPDIWRRWNTANGTGLHPLQLRITLHAAGLLTVGGRMIYSTCSLNPVEDEAVVAEVLRQSQGSLELVDVSEYLPELIRCQGMHKWLVKEKGNYVATFAQAEQESCSNNLSLSMFPDEASDGFPLERCMRILPHHGDTGGFFVAVLYKVAEMPPVKPDRWKRGRELGKEHGRRPIDNSVSHVPIAPAPAAPAMPTENGNQEAKTEPQAKFDQETTDAEPLFNQELGDAAEEAAEAAVTFADALGDQDPEAAVNAAEDAATAVEAVAALAEDQDMATEGTMEESASSPLEGSMLATAGIEAPSAKAAPARDPVREPAREPVTEPANNAQWGSPRGAGGKRREGNKGRVGGLDPVIPFRDVATLDSIVDFFGLPAEFPFREQLVTRSSQDTSLPKRMYYVSSGVKDILVKDEAEALKIIATGLKVLERQEAKDVKQEGQMCHYRIAQEGLPLLLPHITKQRLQFSGAELLRLLRERSVVLPRSLHFSAPAAAEDKPEAGSTIALVPGEDFNSLDEPQAKKPRIEAQTEAPAIQPEARVPEAAPVDGSEEHPKRVPLSDPQTLEQVTSIRGGCCVCELRAAEAEWLGLQARDSSVSLAAAAPLAIAAWRGRASISVLVSINEATKLAEKLEAAVQASAPHINV